MPSNLVKRKQLSRLDRWRLLRVTKKYRKLKLITHRAMAKRNNLRGKDAWAFQFLEHQNLTRRKKGESFLDFWWRAVKTMSNLESPWHERAWKMFSWQMRFMKADRSLAEAAEKRMIIKFGLKRVR